MRGLLLALAALLLGSAPLAAQAQRNEQFYFPGGFNWRFLERYPEAARLFNAFDYGHAVLYERLWTRHPGLPGELEEDEFTYLVRDLLVRPPRFAVVEEVVEPQYAKAFWEAKQMFEWAHILHRQLYDVYADPRLGPAERDSLVERLTDYYLSREDVAFVPVPKDMALMEEQYYSRAFREAYPKFNGLIWSYHWLQVGLYEPLISGRNSTEKKEGIARALAAFWGMATEPPSQFPSVMPMTITVAPQFSAAHPRAAAIFDNLHMMHDIISDILHSDEVPRDRKQAEVRKALAEFRDPTRNVMSLEAWREMGTMMGVAEMGGVAPGGRNGAPPAPAPAAEGEHRH